MAAVKFVLQPRHRFDYNEEPMRREDNGFVSIILGAGPDPILAESGMFDAMAIANLNSTRCAKAEMPCDFRTTDLPVKTEELWGFCASNSHGPRHHITYGRYSSTKR
ncbi:unnamed protein product [Clonostachys rosea f. rosea IK726]|uniref:Uncharacterized protein n=1 Tax=Clonostachys rosea f. rosea IK726 TaxID=1349383 RepID=A0ACA9UF28_BIOOC|nr:unnamed protein product [Clonostachys rosea f. rosea IK726]